MDGRLTKLRRGRVWSARRRRHGRKSFCAIRCTRRSRSSSFLPEEANSVARPNRTDWGFTWERSGFRAKDAPYRLHVTLQGDQIGGYGEALKIPEAWQRSFARLRSSNEFIETLALIPYAILLGAALSIVLALGRRGLANWGSGLKLGLFVTALYFVMQMDQWPLTRAGTTPTARTRVFCSRRSRVRPP